MGRLNLYDVVFFLDIALLLLLLGECLAIAFIYARAFRRSRTRAARRRAMHVILVGGGFAYLLAGAIVSLFATSRHDDETIYFFPPGLVAMLVGISYLFRRGTLSRDRYRDEAT